MQNKQCIIFCWLAELNLMYLKDNSNLNTFRMIINKKKTHFVLHVDDSKYKHTCKSQYSYTDQNNFLNKSRLNILFIVFYGSFEALNKQNFWLNETF